MSEIAKLDQSTFFIGKRLYVLRDDGSMKVTSLFDGQGSEFTVDVGQLTPQPSREKRSARQMIVGMVFFSAISFLFFLPGVLTGTATEARFVFLGIAALFAIPLLLCWLQFKKQSYDVFLFPNQRTGGHIAIHASVPDEPTVQAFIEKLQCEIRKHKTDFVQPLGSLADQIRELAKLHAQGALTEDEFSKAKQALIDAGKAARPIGFGG